MLKSKNVKNVGLLIRTIILVATASYFSFSALAQNAMPDTCIQLPERNDACPNILYKRSPVDIPQYNVTEGEMLCICMADFSVLRIAASDDEGKVKQMVALSKASVKLDIEEKTLLEIIRK